MLPRESSDPHPPLRADLSPMGRGELSPRTDWSSQSHHALLAKGIRSDRLKPLLCFAGFAGAELARRVDRAGRTALDFGENVVLGLIDAGERETVTRRDNVVADAGQPWCFRRLAGQQVHDRS